MRAHSVDYIRHVAGHRTVPVEVGSRYTDDDWSQQLMTINEFCDRFMHNATNESGHARCACFVGCVGAQFVAVVHHRSATWHNINCSNNRRDRPPKTPAAARVNATKTKSQNIIAARPVPKTTSLSTSFDLFEKSEEFIGVD
jgi:hypothetical protein